MSYIPETYSATDSSAVEYINPVIVDLQIAEGLEVASDKNPYDFVRGLESVPPRGFTRQLVAEAGKLDGYFQDPKTYTPTQSERHSIRFQRTTNRRFFEDVDRAIEEAGINSFELRRLQARRHVSRGLDGGKSRQVLAAFIVPIYRQLL